MMKTRVICSRLVFMLGICDPAGSRALADGDAVAVVNGRSISKTDMVRVLMDVKGLDVMQQLILLETAKGETKAKNLRVTEADVEREFQDALERIARDTGLSGETATPANTMQALRSMLEQKKIAMAEYRVAIERNAHLRKIVEAEAAPISEETLRAEWARTHGEKRVVRHIAIPVNDERALSESLNLLRGGTDFSDVARRLSTNEETRSRGGEMDPFTFDEPSLPATFREQAFLMKPGEVSNPVRIEQMFHILKLERVIEPDNARFEDVREQVQRELRARVSDRRMQEVAKELYDKAKVSVIDPGLKAKYEEFQRAQKANAGG
jgi:parvulin-like peptidyl-prolyl isomerase